MRVLITTQVYPPEINPTAVMARELSEGLVARGWQVTVAAGIPYKPTDLAAPSHTGFLRRVEQHQGYQVIRGWHPISRSRAIFVRVAVMAGQMLATFLAALSSPRPDVVLSFGGPPLVGPVLSGVLAWWWKVPLVTVIHDLFPDIAIESGAFRGRLLIGAARWLERLQYQMADRIVVLGGRVRDAIAPREGVGLDRVEVLPVWLDPDEIRPMDRDNAFRREQGIRSDQFVVLCSGTAGIPSGAEILAEVARQLPSDVVVVVVGGGAAWDRLADLRDRGALPGNMRLLPYQPRARVPEVQAAADLSVVTLLPGRGLTSVPSKVQGYMAAGRPVLAVVDPGCDTARAIQEGGFGRAVPWQPADALARCLLELRAEPETLALLGKKARAEFERLHQRDRLIEAYASILGRFAREGRCRA